MPPEEILALAARYIINDRELAITALIPVIQHLHFLTRDQLFLLCQWKNENFPWIAALANNNSTLFVREITTFALTAADERSRIEPLCLLDGVEWPTASTVLHWFHPEPYPILDSRALWSLNFVQPANYDFAFWTNYVVQWRAALADARQLLGYAAITSRIFDRALWQYSYENQPRNGA
jgi:hypothetical protein